MSFGRTMICRVLAWALVAAAPMTRADQPLDGTVLVADDAFTLEDVMEEVLVKRRPGRVTPFWVVITGDQVKLATKGNGMADHALVRGFDLVRQYGGIIYACESDMARLGVTAGDLLPPTEPVRGFGPDGTTDTDSVLYADEDPTLFPESMTQLRRLRAACSGRG
ncbi:MAG: DsrE family protein [Burkholderiales bacterium]|nr:DsrE family protein [Burkholderiales bacterium]